MFVQVRQSIKSLTSNPPAPTVSRFQLHMHSSRSLSQGSYHLLNRSFLFVILQSSIRRGLWVSPVKALPNPVPVSRLQNSRKKYHVCTVHLRRRPRLSQVNHQPALKRGACPCLPSETQESQESQESQDLDERHLNHLSHDHDQLVRSVQVFEERDLEVTKQSQLRGGQETWARRCQRSESLFTGQLKSGVEGR